MSLSEKLENISNNNLIIAENQEKVYKAGQSSMVDESKIIEKTVSGEYISVDDVSEIPHEVKVKLTSGNGKNLFNINSNEIIKGQRIAIKTGGVYPDSAYNVSHYIPVEGGKIYAITTSGAYIYYSFYDENYTYITDTGTSTTRIVTTPQNACYFRFDYPNTDTEVQFEQNDTITPYEPYKETLTDYSGVSLTRCGNNLWKHGDKTFTGVLYSNPVNLLTGITYTFSAEVTTTDTDGKGCLVYDGTNDKVLGYIGLNGAKSITFMPTLDCKTIWLYAGSTNDNSQGDTATFKDIMLNEGSTPLPYEPYNAQTIQANSDGTVEGVKSTSPYMYMTTDNKNVTINATYHKSYGMQTEYDRFWDIYQDYGNRTDYGYAFAGIGWNDDNYKYKYPIVVKTSSPSIFQSCKITDTKDSITFDTAITGITPFYIASSLKTIREIVLNRDISFGEYAFRNCSKLKNIKISGNGKIISSVGFQQSTLLTKESILSIFNALSSTVTGLTLTLSKTAVTNAFGSITATEWTNLVATKTNWTISLI